jgi:YaiO family outer membrane protein
MNRFSILLVIFILPIFAPCSSAQVIPDNPEVAFDTIRAVAFDGRLEDAEVMARQLVKNNPGYGDAVVLLARIIAWQERYNTAIEMLDSLLIEQPGHEDAINARKTIYEWLQSSAVEDSLTADQDVLQGSDDELRTETGNDTTANPPDIHLGYYFDTFNEPYFRFWQIYSVGVEYKTGIGPLLWTFSFGNRNTDIHEETDKSSIQLQGEFWPKISKRTYAWFVYAYSPFPYFPEHRAVAQFWHNLNKGWVLSAGASYYYFDRNILIPTVAVEKYVSNYWFAAQTYIHLKEAGTTSSVFLKARGYFNDIEYIQLTAGAGTAPDEPWDIAADLDRQEAIAFKLTVNKKISDRFIVKCSAGYSHEEYINGQRRNRYEAFIKLIYSPTW